MAAQTEIDFSFDQAVRTMGLTPDKLNRLIADGVIATQPGGFGTRISRRAVLAYMAEVTAVGKERGKKAAAKEAD